MCLGPAPISAAESNNNPEGFHQMQHTKHLWSRLLQFFILHTPQASICSPMKGPSVASWMRPCWTLRALGSAAENSSSLWSLLVRNRPVGGCHWPCAGLAGAIYDTATGGSLSDI